MWYKRRVVNIVLFKSVEPFWEGGNFSADIISRKYVQILDCFGLSEWIQRQEADIRNIHGAASVASPLDVELY